MWVIGMRVKGGPYTHKTHPPVHPINQASHPSKTHPSPPKPTHLDGVLVPEVRHEGLARHLQQHFPRRVQRLLALRPPGRAPLAHPPPAPPAPAMKPAAAEGAPVAAAMAMRGVVVVAAPIVATAAERGADAPAVVVLPLVRSAPSSPSSSSAASPVAVVAHRSWCGLLVSVCVVVGAPGYSTTNSTGGVCVCCRRFDAGRSERAARVVRVSVLGPPPPMPVRWWWLSGSVVSERIDRGAFT